MGYISLLEAIIKEIDNNEDLDREISKYASLSSQIESLKKEIESKVSEIKKLETSQKDTFKSIDKFMQRFGMDKRKVDNWVAQIKEQLKYKVIRPDYKELWLTAFSKVNQATQNVLKSLEETQLETKKKEMEKVLTIGMEESISSFLKNLISKFKRLMNSIADFSRVSNKLPKVK